MAPSEAERIGELLIEEGIVTAEELARAVAEGGVKGTSLAVALESTPHVRRSELASFISSDFRIPVIADLRQVTVAEGMTKLVTENLARKHEMVPLARIGEILCVAKPNYFNRAAIQELRRSTGLKIKVLQADEAQVRALMDRLYKGLQVEIPAPPTRRPETTAFRAQPPRPDPAASLDMPLISMPDEEGFVVAGGRKPGGQGGSYDEVIEILEALKIPPQEYTSALHDPFARLVVEFDDIFVGGRAVSASRAV